MIRPTNLSVLSDSSVGARVYLDTETLEMKEAEMFVEGYKAVLVRDTSFKGRWKVSFTLKEF